MLNALAGRRGKAARVVGGVARAVLERAAGEGKCTGVVPSAPALPTFTVPAWKVNVTPEKLFAPVSVRVPVPAAVTPALVVIVTAQHEVARAAEGHRIVESQRVVDRDERSRVLREGRQDAGGRGCEIEPLAV